MSEAVKYKVRNATVRDVEFLATRLRAIDVREIAAVSPRSTKDALESGLVMSNYCKVGIANGEVFCIYGVRRPTLLSDTGVVWMLATDELEKHSMKFLRKCAIEVDKMLNGFKMIENYCHAENKKTIRWLKWLGFQFEKAEPYGRKKELFHRFYMEAK